MCYFFLVLYYLFSCVGVLRRKACTRKNNRERVKVELYRRCRLRHWSMRFHCLMERVILRYNRAQFKTIWCNKVLASNEKRNNMKDRNWSTIEKKDVTTIRLALLPKLKLLRWMRYLLKFREKLVEKVREHIFIEVVD